jgi:hypothetical protein
MKNSTSRATSTKNLNIKLFHKKKKLDVKNTLKRIFQSSVELFIDAIVNILPFSTRFEKSYIFKGINMMRYEILFESELLHDITYAKFLVLIQKTNNLESIYLWDDTHRIS